MDEREKLLAKVTQEYKATHIGTLVKLMTLWGFNHRFSSSHDNVMFAHRIYPIQQNAGVPHHGPVLGHYVRRCLRAIDDVKEREVGTDG
ncbi:MAG: hypothetical protein ACREQI_13795 [Candidatus Binataceae bacterium]